MFFPMIWMFCTIVCHALAYNNELGEVVEYEMLDPPQCLAEMTPLFFKYVKVIKTITLSLRQITSYL